MIRSRDQLTDPAWRHLVGLALGGPIHVLELPGGWGVHVDVSDDPEETRPYFVTVGSSQVSVTRDELLALAADINAHFAALSAPSEPVPDGPRVLAIPEWPAHWKAFRDAQGFVWRLDEADDRWKRSTGAWTNDPLRMIFEKPYLAPLTEVVEESTP